MILLNSEKGITTSYVALCIVIFIGTYIKYLRIMCAYNHAKWHESISDELG